MNHPVLRTENGRTIAHGYMWPRWTGLLFAMFVLLGGIGLVAIFADGFDRLASGYPIAVDRRGDRLASSSVDLPLRSTPHRARGRRRRRPLSPNDASPRVSRSGSADSAPRPIPASPRAPVWVDQLFLELTDGRRIMLAEHSNPGRHSALIDALRRFLDGPRRV